MLLVASSKDCGLDDIHHREDSAMQGKCNLPGILSVIWVMLVPSCSPPHMCMPCRAVQAVDQC